MYFFIVPNDLGTELYTIIFLVSHFWPIDIFIVGSWLERSFSLDYGIKEIFYFCFIGSYQVLKFWNESFVNVAKIC